MSNTNPVSIPSAQPPSQATRFIARTVEAVGTALFMWSLYGIFAYFFSGADHPFNAFAVFFGFTQHMFLKLSELTYTELFQAFFSVATVPVLYLMLGLNLIIATQELGEVIRAGGFIKLKAIRAEAAAKAKRDAAKAAAESFQAPVDMPRLTKEQWYEILQVTQRAMVREHDALHGGPINLHPAVRERAEHSVSVMGDICSIIVKELPELDGCLTDSYKAVRAKATTTAAPKRT